MKSTQQHSTNDGFTLVEVVLAATIMLAGIVGMMHVITSGSEMLDASRKQTIATQILHGEIERIRVSDWTQINSLSLTKGYAEMSAARTVQWVPDETPAPDQTFQFTRAISKVREDNDNLKKITYTVTWVGNTGRTYTRSTSTYVGKNGLYVAYQR